MSFFAFSDLVIAFTLILNAGAILRINLNPAENILEEPSAVKTNLFALLQTLKLMRFFIAVWNLLVILCMVLLFGS